MKIIKPDCDAVGLYYFHAKLIFNMPHLDKILTINIFNLFVALSYGTILYSGSTYLSGIYGAQNIWIIYTLAALLTITLNFSVTKILRKIKIEKVVKLVSLLAFANLLFLYTGKSQLAVGITFIIYIVFSEFLTMLSSIMTEDLSKNSSTGEIRGRFISIQSLGYMVAPFISSFILNIYSIKEIFIMSSAFVLLAFFIFNIFIKNIPPIQIHNKNIGATIKNVWKNTDIRNIIFAQTGLATFYSLAIIYIPFKLSSVGISLSTYLGILLPFALLPFLFVPNILGHLEDRMKNEKEFLIFAYLGLILSVCLFAFTNTNSIFVWAALLFMSRVFASAADTSIASYLFKKINSSDTATISIFSSVQSISFIIFTPIFGLLLKYSDLEILFLSVSFFLCFVLVLVCTIHDTKNYEKHQIWKRIWQKSQKRSLQK